MIKHDLGKVLYISGHPVQVATEFEELSRNVRRTFCQVFGNEIGGSLFEECIRNSKMTAEERDANINEQIKAAELNNPEAVKICERLSEKLFESIFGGAIVLVM